MGKRRKKKKKSYVSIYTHTDLGVYAQIHMPTHTLILFDEKQAPLSTLLTVVINYTMTFPLINIPR